MSFSANITAVAQPWERRNTYAAPRSYSLLTILETGFVIVALFLLTEGLLPLLRSQSLDANIDPSQGDPLMQGLLGSIYALSILFLGVRPLIKSAFSDKWLLLLMVLVALSAAWSVDPSVTLRRGAALLGTSIFGMYFASRFSLRRQLKLLAATLAVAALLSIVFAVLLPKYGIMTGEHAGEWEGIYLHKNVLGRMMVLGEVCFLLLARTEQKRAVLWLSGFGLCFFVMVMSRSVTAAVVLALLLATYPVAKALRWPSWRWRHSILTPILFFSAFAVVVATIVVLSDPKLLGKLFELLGRDKTLTGRTALWEGVVYAIGKHPWLGYGYGAFWETDTRELFDTWKIAGFQAPHAHNGLLQLMLDSGIVGALLFGISLVLTLRMAIIWIRRRENDESLWALFYLIFMLCYNITEPTILKHNSIFWMLYVAVALSLRKCLRESTPRSVVRVTPAPSPPSHL